MFGGCLWRAAFWWPKTSRPPASPRGSGERLWASSRFTRFTHYDLLQVSQDAAQDEIKRAFHSLAKTYHPDRNSSPEATQYFQSILDAYHVLADPGARRGYDDSLGPTKKPPARRPGVSRSRDVDPGFDVHTWSEEIFKAWEEGNKRRQQKQQRPQSQPGTGSTGKPSARRHAQAGGSEDGKKDAEERVEKLPTFVATRLWTGATPLWKTHFAQGTWPAFWTGLPHRREHLAFWDNVLPYRLCCGASRSTFAGYPMVVLRLCSLTRLGPAIPKPVAPQTPVTKPADIRSAFAQSAGEPVGTAEPTSETKVKKKKGSSSPPEPFVEHRMRLRKGVGFWGFCGGVDVTGMSSDQSEALRLLTLGRSVFCTGSAGTGKSFLLDRIVSACHKRAVGLTASTGVAARNIGGWTLHAWAGIGKGEDSVDTLLGTMPSAAKKRWKDCQMLIIDEISMVDAPLLDKLDLLARTLRNSTEPFGGIQLLLTGDFFQLPPVRLGSKNPAAQYCFNSQAWASIDPVPVFLTKNFRQNDDPLVKILEEARWGKLSDQSRALLESRVGLLYHNDAVLPTHLYSLRKNVDQENINMLKKLEGPERIYTAEDKGNFNVPRSMRATVEAEVSLLEKGCLAPTTLILREGAQVMLLQNWDVTKGLVNGSRGVVVNLGRGGDPYPMVKFDGGIELRIRPVQFSKQVENRVVASRTQLPLMLAWAFTVHKCQGMTLDKVSISMRDYFEMGQMYVALSRVRRLERLYLDSFNPGAFRPPPAVVKFYYDLLQRYPDSYRPEAHHLPVSAFSRVQV
eukprot:RCo012367